MKAIVLLSGGLDSTVMLALALSKGRECIALTFNYHQRNHYELEAARSIAQHYGLQHKLITLSPNTFATSTLVSTTSPVPKDRSVNQIYHCGIPNTYVPARNTLFLAYAAGQAEIYDAQEIYIGVNAADRGGYPDARIEYIQAMQAVFNIATKQATQGVAPTIVVPLVKWHKRDIVKQGVALKAPLQLTMSCYDPGMGLVHCGRCDACYLRKEGFISSRRKDPTAYNEQGVPLGAAESCPIS
jgi:7-cyano-7-deazaguanine synthase